MDWGLAIESEREVLKRILALFYALAVLTDRASGRSRPVRCFVLWILRPAVAVALDCIADARPLNVALVRERCDSIAEARRYSRCFRAAARSMKRLIKELARCKAHEEALSISVNRRPLVLAASSGRRLADRNLLALLRNLAPVLAGLSSDACAPALLRLDTS